MTDKPADRPPIEPHADIRQIAVNAMQMYIAFTDTGFTEQQALQLVIAVIQRQDR